MMNGYFLSSRGDLYAVGGGEQHRVIPDEKTAALLKGKKPGYYDLRSLVAKFDPNEPRDERGRWTNGAAGGTMPGKAPRFAGQREVAGIDLPPTDFEQVASGVNRGSSGLQSAMMSAMQSNGGFTFEPHTVRTPTSGYAVGGYGVGDAIFDANTFSPNDVSNFMRANAATLKGNYVGGWLDEGKVHLDVTKVFPTRDAAISAGKERNQISIADLGALHAGQMDRAFIPTGGTGHIGKGQRVLFLFDGDAKPEDIHAAIVNAGGQQRQTPMTRLSKGDAAEMVSFREAFNRMFKPFREIAKDFDVGDVHTSTALGNERPKRRKPKFFGAKSKPIPFSVAKIEPDKQLLFGWASVVEENGQLIVDKQGDVIFPEDLENAAYGFVLHVQEPVTKRGMGDMHARLDVGRPIESMVFTKEKQDALGIDLGKVGWWIGFKVDDPEVWAAYKRGERPEFSIGGSGTREEYVTKYSPNQPRVPAGTPAGGQFAGDNAAGEPRGLPNMRRGSWVDPRAAVPGDVNDDGEVNEWDKMPGEQMGTDAKIKEIIDRQVRRQRYGSDSAAKLFNELLKYSPDEARDAHGRWTSGGGPATGGTSHIRLYDKVATWVRSTAGHKALVKGVEAVSLELVGETVANAVATIVLGPLGSMATSLVIGSVLQAAVQVGLWHVSDSIGITTENLKNAAIGGVSAMMYALRRRIGKSDDQEVYDYLAAVLHALQQAQVKKAMFDDLIVKYSPSQPRDAHGRWTSGGGESVGEAVQRMSREAGQASSEFFRTFPARAKAWLEKRLTKEALAHAAAEAAIDITAGVALAEVAHFLMHFSHLEAVSIGVTIKYTLHQVSEALGVDYEVAKEFLSGTITNLIKGSEEATAHAHKADDSDIIAWLTQLRDAINAA